MGPIPTSIRVCLLGGLRGGTPRRAWADRAPLDVVLRGPQRMASRPKAERRSPEAPSPAELHGSSIEEHRAAKAKELGLASPEALPLVLLPANRSSLRSLPERREKRFRAHLHRVVEEAFGAPVPPLSTEAELGDSPLIQEACAVCRGRCCHAGADHAFVDAPTVHAYRRANPEAGPEEVIEAYLSRLGEEALENGCVFQGEKGCRLPRSMRAAICNGFLCSPLESFRAPADVTSNPRALAAAMHGEKLVRIAVIGDPQK